MLNAPVSLTSGAPGVKFAPNPVDLLNTPVVDPLLLNVSEILCTLPVNDLVLVVPERLIE